ncbi:MAG: hypothetical protein Q8S09_05750 [Hyphomonas sp.]|nr:hypothetical protein [Hyphomonas sp.]
MGASSQPAPVPEDRETRVRLALAAALEALKLARREAEGAAADPVRLGWAALGIVSALQGALVAALSGYETATTDAVLNPSQPEWIAPVALLLRRVRSGEYLNAPERLELSGRQQRALDRVIDVRNAAVHALSVGIPETFVQDVCIAVRLIEHLVLDAPAFDPAPVRVVSALIADELKALGAALREMAGD